MIPGLRQEEYKIRLKPLVLESNEVFKKKKMKAYQKGTETSLKELPVAKARTIRTTKSVMIVLNYNPQNKIDI